MQTGVLGGSWGGSVAIGRVLAVGGGEGDPVRSIMLLVDPDGEL